MDYFKSHRSVWGLIVLVECCLFCTSFVLLFRKVIADGLSNGSVPEKVFTVFFFGGFAVTALWTLAEILLYKNVELADGFLVVKRGVFVINRVSYPDIARIQHILEVIEYSRKGLARGILFYRGEKMRIHTVQGSIDVRSISIKDYKTFRKLLPRLAVNAQQFGVDRFVEEKEYVLLLLGGFLILGMIWALFH